MPEKSGRGEAEGVAAALFRRVCGAFATGVTVATVTGRDGKPHGLTVNSFTSVSLHPPLVLVCIGHKAATHGPFSTAAHFAVNFLDESQQELSERFASSHPRRFEGLRWQPGETGAPVLEDALGVLECETWRKMDAGDHTVFFGLVKSARAREGRPLIYFGGKYRQVRAD
jgi:flavin reductase (DIM6/NTAB) family NADH-FMN oxidoreductase RutF